MSEQNYRALTTGNYIVQASGVEVRRTGRFEQVQNDKRRWFTPWRPKFITIQSFEEEAVLRERRYPKSAS